MNNQGVTKLEPVRVIGYVMTAIVLISAVVKQVADNYDEGTGWIGLAFAAMMAVGTELQRARVTPVAKLTQQDDLSGA